MSDKTYIDEVVELIGKHTRIKSKDLQRYYALLVLVKGDKITLSDVHDGWAMSMNYREQNKYCYGHEHKSIVPFDKLSAECQLKDQEFVDGLKEVAHILEGK